MSNKLFVKKVIDKLDKLYTLYIRELYATYFLNRSFTIDYLNKYNINWRDVQRNNCENNVDMSSLSKLHTFATFCGEKKKNICIYSLLPGYIEAEQVSL